MTQLFTNQKKIDRAIKAAVDQADKVKGFRTHCMICGCTPKPDEWTTDVQDSMYFRYCFDCV